MRPWDCFLQERWHKLARQEPDSASAAQHQGRKKRVAILDFDYATVQTNSAAVFGTNVDIGKGITDLLVKYWSRTAPIP